MPCELNVDESHLLSQAMKFVNDPRPWIAADTTSSGPLNSYLIAVCLWMGFKAGFVLVHILAMQKYFRARFLGDLRKNLQIYLLIPSQRTHSKAGKIVCAKGALFVGLSSKLCDKQRPVTSRRPIWMLRLRLRGLSGVETARQCYRNKSAASRRRA